MSETPPNPPTPSNANQRPIERAPWAYDLFNVVRAAEAAQPDRPRVGDSARRTEDILSMGQDPFLEFPGSTLNRAGEDSDGRLLIYSRFLGLMGPQGALPLTLTEEAFHWQNEHDDAFPRFCDLLNQRFLQLFFRAWADSRPIAQYDRPKNDRFHDYLASLVGIGTPTFHNLDAVPDIGKLAYAGLLSSRVTSASRLSDFIAGFFGVTVEIIEFLPEQLPLDPADQTQLGAANSALGVDCLVGSSVLSFQDRFRIRVFTTDLEQYESFLPRGDMARKLADSVRFYIGDELEWDIELALPREAAPAAQLGAAGRLGWTGWMSPGKAPTTKPYLTDARFRPSFRGPDARRTG